MKSLQESFQELSAVVDNALIFLEWWTGIAAFTLLHVPWRFPKVDGSHQSG